jgi:hypothetical protein
MKFIEFNKIKKLGLFYHLSDDKTLIAFDNKNKLSVYNFLHDKIIFSVNKKKINKIDKYIDMIFANNNTKLFIRCNNVIECDLHTNSIDKTNLIGVCQIESFLLQNKIFVLYDTLLRTYDIDSNLEKTIYVSNNKIMYMKRATDSDYIVINECGMKFKIINNNAIIYNQNLTTDFTCNIFNNCTSTNTALLCKHNTFVLCDGCTLNIYELDKSGLKNIYTSGHCSACFSIHDNIIAICDNIQNVIMMYNIENKNAWMIDVHKNGYYKCFLLPDNKLALNCAHYVNIYNINTGLVLYGMNEHMCDVVGDYSVICRYGDRYALMNINDIWNQHTHYLFKNVDRLIRVSMYCIRNMTVDDTMFVVFSYYAELF